jgi:hypothetical protein
LLLSSERARHDGEERRVSLLKLDSMRSTCAVTATGRARKQPLSAIACCAALPALTPGIVQKAGRGNQFKLAEVFRAGLKALAQRSQAQAVAAKQLKRQRPATARQRVQAERLPAGVARGGHATKRTKRAAAEAAEGAYADCDDDYEMDEDYGAQLSDEDGEASDVEVADGNSDEEEMAETLGSAPLPSAPPSAPAAPPRSALTSEQQGELSGLRKQIAIWEERFHYENKRPAKEGDRSFHINYAYEELAELEKKL